MNLGYFADGVWFSGAMPSPRNRPFGAKPGTLSLVKKWRRNAQYERDWDTSLQSRKLKQLKGSENSSAPTSWAEIGRGLGRSAYAKKCMRMFEAAGGTSRIICRLK